MLACAEDAGIFALANATLMPRPIAAGVFGMARTIAVPTGNDFSRKAMVRPAMIDNTSVALPTYLASGGNTRTRMRFYRDHNRAGWVGLPSD